MQPVFETLCAIGLYRKARLARNRYLRRDLWERAARWRNFYSQFISQGDLVFDIGANRGDRTELFVQMGARVVAVEPINSLARRLNCVFRYSPVNVEAVGVGSAPGSLPIHICSDKEMSSFSANFIEKKSKEYIQSRWESIEHVPIVTLNSLVEKYGTPSFIKIDVEGFEIEVLSGLSTPVNALSFEVHHDSQDMVAPCLEKIESVGTYEFNLSVEETLALEMPRWSDGASVLASIRRLAASGWRSYGDVYALRVNS